MKSAHGQLRDILKQARRLHADAEKALSTVRDERGHDERGHVSDHTDSAEAVVNHLALAVATIEEYFTATEAERHAAS